MKIPEEILKKNYAIRFKEDPIGQFESFVVESMHEYAEMRVKIAQTYWAERFEDMIEKIEKHPKFYTEGDFDNLVEEMKTAKYFP